MDYLLKVSAIIILFYGFYKLILQRETFFQSNRWFLLIGILTAILAPLIVIPIYIEAINSPIYFTNANLSNNTEIIKETINWNQVLIFIYSIGVVFLSGRFTVNLVSLYKLISSHSKENDANYQLIKTKKNTTPFSFFNYIVYNPSKFKTNELNQIIIHEKVHAQQHHSIDILISQIVTIIFWFNPFVWLYKKEIQQNLEFIADDLAQQESTCEKSYQKLLLKTSLPKNKFALTNNFYNSLIKKRIIMLHKNRSKSKNQWKYALILPLMAAFVFTFNTKTIAQNNSSKKEIHFEKNIDLIITKDTKKSDFNKIKKEFLKEDVTVNFKNIKRNSKGEIIGIAIDLKSKSSNATYSMASDEPIKPIEISSNENGEDISIRTSDSHHGEDYFFVSKDENHKIHSTKKGNNFVFVTEDGEVHSNKSGKHKIIEIDVDENNKDDNSIIWITKDGDKTKTHHKSTYSKIEIVKGGDEKDHNIFISKQGDNLLYYIDGKKVSKKYFKNFNSDKIEKMEVLKGDKAIEKYGKKAKDGVILITTKKE